MFTKIALISAAMAVAANASYTEENFGDLSFLDSMEAFKEAESARDSYVADHLKLVEARAAAAHKKFTAVMIEAEKKKLMGEFAADLKAKMDAHKTAKAHHYVAKIASAVAKKAKHVAHNEHEAAKDAHDKAHEAKVAAEASYHAAEATHATAEKALKAAIRHHHNKEEKLAAA